MNRRKVDVSLSAVLIIVSLIVLTNDSLVEGGMETELGSMFLPRLVAVFIIMFAATIGIQSLLKLHKKAELGVLEYIDTTGFLGIGIYVAIFVLYWFLVPYTGFLITTPIVMMSIGVLLGGRSWLPMATVSVITPLLVFYGCSNYLRVFLPTWSLS